MAWSRLYHGKITVRCGSARLDLEFAKIVEKRKKEGLGKNRKMRTSSGRRSCKQRIVVFLQTISRSYKQ